MMMPPKKSKAARGVAQAQAQAEEDEKAASVAGPANGQAAPQEKEGGGGGGGDEDDKHVNIFEETVVEGKRKRLMPPGEQKLNDWLSDNFEEKENSQIKHGSMYEAFVDYCASTMNAFTVDEPVFMKIVKARFPKGYCVKEDSVYRATLKEKKATKPAPKVQADSLKLKMRDIITKAMQDLGNPSKGLRFNVLKNHLAMRYPALRLDFNPRQLVNGLFLGVRAGYLERVRGIGKMGLYRMPGPALIEEKEVDKKKKKPAMKDGIPSEGAKEKGTEEPDEAGSKPDDEASGEKADDEQDKDDEKKTKSKKLTKKRKKDTKADESSATDEAAEQKADGDAEDDDKEKSADDQDKSKEKKKKKKTHKKQYRKHVVHSDPQRVEDCFQLAFTYMTEPKESSVSKIRSYILKYYPDADADRIKETIESGIDKCYWELVRGTVSNGTFRLLLDEVDASADDDLIGQICNAIMATTAPKACSALLLKRYITDYHPNLNVLDRPHLFKRALERGVNNGTIRQLSGIGAVGSFELAQPFIPNPIILSGRDTSSDYESDIEIGDIADNHDIMKYADMYKPRPTKCRGKGRVASKEGKSVLQGDDNEPPRKKTKGELKEEEEPEVYYDAYIPRPTSRGLGRGPPGAAPPLVTKAAKKARPIPKEPKKGHSKKGAVKKEETKKETVKDKKKPVSNKKSAKGKGKAKKKGGKKK